MSNKRGRHVGDELAQNMVLGETHEAQFLHFGAATLGFEVSRRS